MRNVQFTHLIDRAVATDWSINRNQIEFNSFNYEIATRVCPEMSSMQWNDQILIEMIGEP